MTNNQLAENSVIQLLNSVKLARDNAERADNRVDHSFYYALTIALDELQERRKAAMDSEPVAYTDEEELNFVNDMACMWTKGMGINEVPLYRHAQPPVTDKQPAVAVGGYRKLFTCSGCGAEGLDEPLESRCHCGMEGAHWIEGKVYLAPQPAPVVPDEVEHVAAVLELIGSFEAADIDSDTVDLRFEIDDVDTGSDASITEYAARGAAIIRMLAGNSPVIGIDMASGPDHSVEVRYVAPPGYVMVPKEPTEEMLAAAKEWTDLTSTAETVYIKMLAAVLQEVK